MGPPLEAMAWGRLVVGQVEQGLGSRLVTIGETVCVYWRWHVVVHRESEQGGLGGRKSTDEGRG